MKQQVMIALGGVRILYEGFFREALEEIVETSRKRLKTTLYISRWTGVKSRQDWWRTSKTAQNLGKHLK